MTELLPENRLVRLEKQESLFSSVVDNHARSGG